MNKSRHIHLNRHAGVACANHTSVMRATFGYLLPSLPLLHGKLRESTEEIMKTLLCTTTYNSTPPHRTHWTADGGFRQLGAPSTPCGVSLVRSEVMGLWFNVESGVFFESFGRSWATVFIMWAVGLAAKVVPFSGPWGLPKEGGGSSHGR